MVSGVGRFEAAEIGEVLAQGQLALDVYTGKRLVSIELLGKHVRVNLVPVGGLPGPPVAQSPLGIELAAFVIEAVAHLMPDGRTGFAIVDGGIGAGVEEGRLELGGGKGDLVHD